MSSSRLGLWKRLGKAPAGTLVAALLIGVPAIGLSAAGVADSLAVRGAEAATDSLSGTVVDHSTNQPVTGATLVLEQPDVDGIDRIVARTTAGPGGFFTFTGLPAGDYYDVVADASRTSSFGNTQTYAATVTFAVPVGTMLSRIPLVPEFGDAARSGQPAQISATVTTSTSSGGPAQADVRLSALERASLENGSAIEVSIPPFSGSTPEVTTFPNANCANGTACVSYVLFVPSSDPVYGTYHLGGTNYAIPTAGPAEVIYHIDGRAFLSGTNTPDCNPSTRTSGQVVPRGTLVSTIPNLNFTGCE